MKLKRVRVQKYRSIRDTGWIDIDDRKTILVGPNEAGKTALLKAIERLNPPEDIPFDALRDLPRDEYDEFLVSGSQESDTEVVRAEFELDEDEVEYLSTMHQTLGSVSGLTIWVTLDSHRNHRLLGGPSPSTYGELAKDLARLASHCDEQHAYLGHDTEKPSSKLEQVTKGWPEQAAVSGNTASGLSSWLQEVAPLVDEDNEREEERHDQLVDACQVQARRNEAAKWLLDQLPVLVYFHNYFRVRPNIHLEKLAEREEQDLLEDKTYDFGNLCLLNLLGFTPRELSDLGKVRDVKDDTGAEMVQLREKLDKRRHRLNSASLSLTRQVQDIWQADDLDVVLDVDQQYLNVLVRDDLGAEIELDQRSEGFQWCVSFWVVFRAQARDRYKNAILLLDEPGVSLHGLKQTIFRKTLSTLSESNQLLYTTHSPFLVGPDELDLVRVIEMPTRELGTIVHNDPQADQGDALLPLQEALGYDLAHSLFSTQRNLILEGLTDYWYIESVAALLADSAHVRLNPKIALHSADSAGKLVYYATILHSHNLKVAALLDSDAAGDQAAQQETLVHRLGNERILRTADFYSGPVKKVEIEELLRTTLLSVAKEHLGWDVEATATAQPERPIVDILVAEVGDFSKYRLAKAFVRWTRDHDASDLTAEETEDWKQLIASVNKALE